MILQPSDTRAAFELAQQAAQLAAGLDDLTRAKAALALGMSAIWVQPELVPPALREALARFGDDHPWECAVTMQCLANTSGGLAEALDWGQESVALFRRVGDHMYAANTLFIMAQRSMYAGIADDQVHQWLTESQALAEAAGSEDDQVHAMVGFGQLAWLRGDHAGAAQLMEECLPALRRRGDQRCTGRALHMLGERAHEQRQLARAEELLRGSVAAVAVAGQSRRARERAGGPGRRGLRPGPPAPRGHAPRHSAHRARVGQRAHATHPATRPGASPVAGQVAGHRSLRRRLRRGPAAVPDAGAAGRLVRPARQLPADSQVTATPHRPSAGVLPTFSARLSAWSSSRSRDC